MTEFNKDDIRTLDEILNNIGVSEEFRGKQELIFLKRVCTDLEKKDLSKLTEEELIIEAQKGDQDAKLLLVENNKGYIMNIVSKYHNSCLSTSELVQEGIIGMLESLEKFDVALGYKFITYATWHIQNRLSKAIWKSRPGGLYMTYVDYRNEIDSFKKKTYEEKEDGNMNNAITHGEDMDTFSQEYVEIDIDSLSNRLLVDKILDRLDRDDQEIFCMHLGLRGQTPTTFREMEKKLNGKREALRKRYNEIMEKVKKISTEIGDETY